MTQLTELLDVSLLESIIEKYEGRKRDALLPMLHDAQAVYGWLPREVQEAIGRTLNVPLAEVYGVVEFYTMFYDRPTAKQVIRVCKDPACYVGGADAVGKAIEEQLGLTDGETAFDGSITFEYVPCLGMCEHAPNALYGDTPAGDLTVDTVDDFLNEAYPEPEARIYGKPLIKLRRAGVVNPLSLRDYVDHEGFSDLRKALDYNPEEIIALLKESKILGRGGAMFPTGLKWEFTRRAPGTPAEKHIIANADESEPGTFKDRGLMEEDPYSLIEAMLIAGYTVGAENGWIFVRGEYPRSYARLSNAVRRAREEGYLGRNILGREGFNFDIQIRLGAGAYICGEETALFEAIEGKRGFPRIKPPFPTTNGLFNQPTAINNVETLAAALAVVHMGVDEWLKLGTEQSPGTKWFCLSGNITQPGLYEVPFGLTIRELVEMAGGVPGSRPIQAVLLGGAAGVFLAPDKLDMQLTYEDARKNGVPLGSGVIQVFDDTVDLREILYRLSHFFAHESCGKCYPCQIGTQRQMEIFDRIAHNGGSRPSDYDVLRDLGFTMTQTSLCGLGQTAASAVTSALELWPELLA
ncbi:MAG: NAD(P)H-dependent oxidoreductase subunit E [Candidatus Promineifilaceae bacterium]|jgi:NADH-quinone oxidoreductase subunit F